MKMWLSTVVIFLFSFQSLVFSQSLLGEHCGLSKLCQEGFFCCDLHCCPAGASCCSWLPWGEECCTPTKFIFSRPLQRLHGNDLATKNGQEYSNSGTDILSRLTNTKLSTK
uniref:Cysteine rich secreted protein n=1 Tax=Riptortus pedestris TaxID=329032 RepID=R4WIH6_RIPPE|nr:cysteine rich secreted protein [Riptortus pedestris]